MKWRDILTYIQTYGKDTLSIISNLINDQDFRNNLDRVGGLFALVSMALEVTNKIYDETKSPKVKAYNKLSIYVLKITKELLKDLKPNNNIDTKMMLKQIEQSFDKASDEYDLSDWDSYVPNHPAIITFKEKIKNCLMVSNPKEINIISRIDFELKRQASTDNDYKVFNDWWEGQKQYKELIGYLRHIEDLNNDTFNIPNNKPLKDYYIQNNVIPDIPIDTLNLKHDQIRNDYPSKEILESIREFVDNPSKLRSSETTLVIAGSVGIGKTSAVKMISASYASEYLSSDLENSSNLHMPIPISLKNPGLKTEDDEYSLDDILEKIAPEDDAVKKYTPILIIFDTLEKYKDEETMGEKIDELKKGHPNIKVIITTTLDQKLLVDQRIRVKKYSRLIPFNKIQLDKFFEKYNVMLGKQQLTYKDALDLGLPVEQMLRPLFAWIFSYLETSGYGVKIVEKGSWTPKMKKAWIYMLFIHRIIAGKPREAFTNPYTGIEYYLLEKKILRAVAAIKQIHKIPPKNSIDSKTVEAEIKKTVNEIQDPNFDKDILKYKESYFLSVQYDKNINFLDESFNDYFLAEYYIESILHKEPLKLNIGIPNKQTIEFLDGLLDLLNATDKDIEESIGSSSTPFEKASLLGSFNYKKGRNKAKDELISTTSDLVEKEYVIFHVLEDDNLDKKQEAEGIWKKLDITNKEFKQLWIHRWVSLFILNKLTAKDEEKRNIINHKYKEVISLIIHQTLYHLILRV